jgi:predicted nucleic acid-binding protein
VLDLEHARSPFPERRERVGALIELARERVYSTPAILERAKDLESSGFGGRDALHLASAEHARADRFVTSDDRLIAKTRQIELSIKVVSPLELFEEGVI